MTPPERLYSFWNAVNYVVNNHIPGDFVECGVWRGGSAMMAAMAFMTAGDLSRKLWLYDTFAGMPPPSENDIQIRSGKHAREYLETEDRVPAYNTWAIADFDDVQKNIYSTGYPQEKIVFRKGLVQETLREPKPDTISILRLDTDWYDSTRLELKELWPLLVRSGVLIIDDYGWWKGQKQAVDEFFAAMSFKPCFFRIDVAMVMLIKP